MRWAKRQFAGAVETSAIGGISGDYLGFTVQKNAFSARERR